MDTAALSESWSSHLRTVLGPVSQVVGGLDAGSVCFRAKSFFVAWNGVLTLAFDGYPSSLVSAKVELLKTCPALRKENSGSNWPKFTLGVLRDGLELTESQLDTLHTLCVKFHPILARSLWNFQPSAASVCVFQCRSLERLLFRCDIPLSQPRSEHLDPYPVLRLVGSASNCDGVIRTTNHLVSDTERERVCEVLSDFLDAPRSLYLPYVNRPSNRESHYRNDHEEATLVCFLETDAKLRKSTGGTARECVGDGGKFSNHERFVDTALVPSDSKGDGGNHDTFVECVGDDSNHDTFVECVGDGSNHDTFVECAGDGSNHERFIAALISSDSKGDMTHSQVHDCCTHETQPPFLAEFRADVDEALPGCYVWFRPDSLHLTIRTLNV